MEASVKRLASIISCWVIFLLMSPQSRAADLDGLVSSLKDGGYVASDPMLKTPLYLQAGDGALAENLQSVADEILQFCVPG
jgi:hypothetical protein